MGQEEAFKMVDNILMNGVRSITDIVVKPGKINCDFADVTTIMSGMGRAIIGRGIMQDLTSFMTLFL